MSILIYVCIVLFSAVQSVSTKLFNRKNNQMAVFNALKSVSAFLLIGTISVSQFSFHVPTIVYGLGYGGALCISMYAGYRALCLGPMALTSMLISFSVILPFLWGVVIRHEMISGRQYFAIVLLFAAIVLLNTEKYRCKKQLIDEHFRWLFFAAVTFFCNGICSVLQKEHQTRFPVQYNEMFMLYALLICASVYLGIALYRISYSKFRNIKGKHYAILSGLSNAAANFLTLRLAAFENASVLFPVVSAGTIFAALISGRLIFKETIKPNQGLALTLGVISIVLLKL